MQTFFRHFWVSKQGKVNVEPMPVDDTLELMPVKELGRYLPSHPTPVTVYGWIREHSIPHYKQGKTVMCKKSKIDKWLLCTKTKDSTEPMEEVQLYCATPP